MFEIPTSLLTLSRRDTEEAAPSARIIVRFREEPGRAAEEIFLFWGFIRNSITRVSGVKKIELEIDGTTERSTPFFSRKRISVIFILCWMDFKRPPTKSPPVRQTSPYRFKKGNKYQVFTTVDESKMIDKPNPSLGITLVIGYILSQSKTPSLRY